MNTHGWAKSRTHSLVSHVSPRKCEGGGENLYGGIKNPTEVDSSIVTTVPLWCGKLIVREAVLVVGAGDI